MIKFPGEKIPSKQKVYYLNNHSLEVGDSPKGDVVHVHDTTTTIESQQYSSHCNTVRLSTNVSPNKTIILSKKNHYFRENALRMELLKKIQVESEQYHILEKKGPDGVALASREKTLYGIYLKNLMSGQTNTTIGKRKKIR